MVYKVQVVLIVAVVGEEEGICTTPCSCIVCESALLKNLGKSCCSGNTVTLIIHTKSNKTWRHILAQSIARFMIVVLAFANLCFFSAVAFVEDAVASSLNHFLTCKCAIRRVALGLAKSIFT